MVNLEALHDRHHELLREQLFTVLARLVDVDIAGAGVVFGEFVVDLEAGLAVEEGVVMAVYRVHGPKEGSGKPEIVEGDHVILRRGIETVLGFLAAHRAAGPTTLRAILEELPHVYRLIATLEHHTLREQKHVYPVIAGALDDGQRAAVVAELTRLVDVTRAR